MKTLVRNSKGCNVITLSSSSLTSHSPAEPEGKDKVHLRQDILVMSTTGGDPVAQRRSHICNGVGICSDALVLKLASRATW